MIANLLSILIGHGVAKAAGGALGVTSQDVDNLIKMNMSKAPTAPNGFLAAGQNYFSAAFSGLVSGNRSRPTDLTGLVSRISGNYNDARVAATKMGMLEMMRDSRYSNLYTDPTNATALGEIEKALRGNLNETETRMHFARFASAFQSVSGAGDVLNRRIDEYSSINRKVGNVTAANPMAAFSDFSRTPTTLGRPGFSRQIDLKNLTADQKGRLDAFNTGLKDRNVNVSRFDAKKDIFSIRSTFEGKDYNFTYAQMRIGEQSFMVPLDDVASHKIAGVGNVYFRDSSGSSMYSAAGKTLDYGDRTSAPVMRDGLEYLFGGGKDAKVLDIIQESYKTGKSLDDLLFSMDGSATEGAVKLLEFVDQSQNPILSIARKEAQMQVMDPTRPAQMRAVDAFAEYERAATANGYTLLPVSSPGQLANDKYFATPTRPGRREDTPLFLRAMNLIKENGEFVMQSDLEKRPVRPGTEPFSVINPGSTRALNGLGDVSDMYVFSKGAYADMQRTGMSPFVRGTWYHNKKGKAAFSNLVPLKDMSDSAGFTLDLRLPTKLTKSSLASMGSDELGAMFESLGSKVTDIEAGTAQGKSAIFEIDKTFRDPATNKLHPHTFNPKLEQAFRTIDTINQSGSMNIEQRRNAVKGLNLQFSEDEFLGFSNVMGNPQKQMLSVSGQGAIGIEDIISTNNGYKLVFARTANLTEGAKIEGSTVSTISRNLLTGKSRGKYHEAYTKELLGIIGGPGPTPFPTGAYFNPKNKAGQTVTFQSLSDKDKLEAFNKAIEDVENFSKINPAGTPLPSPLQRVANVRDQARRSVLGGLITEKEKILKDMGYEGNVDDIDFIAENKRLGGGNIKELRTQQQTSLARAIKEQGRGPAGMTLGGINSYDLSKTNTARFSAAMESSLSHRGYYNKNDTMQLARYLKVAQEQFGGLGAKPQSDILGTIFGMEGDVDDAGKFTGALGKVLTDHRQSLLDMGLNDSFLKNLESGMKESKGSWGASWHNIRDISDVEASGEVGLERRFIDHLFQSTDTDPEFAPMGQNIIDTITKRMRTADPGHVDAVRQMVESQRQGALAGSRLLDIENVTDQVAATKVLDEIKTQGGYIRYRGTDYFLPDEALLQRVTTIDDRAGSNLKNVKIQGIVGDMLRSAQSGIGNTDTNRFSVFEQRANELTEETFRLASDIFNAPFESKLRGSAYGQIRQAMDTKQRNRLYGYTVGMNKTTIDNMFAEMARNSGKEEADFLDMMKKEVMSGKRGFAVMGWQNPKIGPEAMSIFEGYYDSKLDKVGGFSVGATANAQSRGQGGFMYKTAGFLTGKTSSDYDGDKANFVVMGASSNNKNATAADAQQNWSKYFSSRVGGSTPNDSLLSQQSMRQQRNRQRNWFGGGGGAPRSAGTPGKPLGAYEYEKKIKSSLDSLSATGPMPNQMATLNRGFARTDLLQTAYRKGIGQAEVGLMSNRVTDMHSINYSMRQAGAMDVGTSRQVSKFLQALEQEAVGFKHTSGFSAAAHLEDKMGAILEQGRDVNEATREYFDLLKSLGFDDTANDSSGNAVHVLDAAMADQGRATKAAAAMSYVRDNYANIDASRKSEKVTAQAVLNSVGSGFKNAQAALHAINPQMSEMLTSAALNAINDPSARGRYKKDVEERIANLNAASQSGGGGAAAERVALNKNAQRALSEGFSATKSLLENKMARPMMIGAAAMAGAYAIFNKGYDDTPLTDIPPPPPGRSSMTASNADLESVRSGNLLGDHYGGQDTNTAGALGGGGYVEGNIPEPSSISQKSYLNSATARISNRGVVLDRSNPTEYARAIQGSIPGAQVGVSINHNYNIPKDMDRHL